jgi:hypothetical protein
LPTTNVLQGYYAMKTLGADAVSLSGERAPGDAAGLVQILPTQAIAQIGDAAFDLVLNQDSFPEMSAATVHEYLRWIRRSCAGALLSINHESRSSYGHGLRHVVVPEAVAEVGGYELRHRYPYWLRRGYVVELYAVPPRR